MEQTSIEEILNFGAFSSLLNKSHSANSTSKSENSVDAENDSKCKEAHGEEDDVGLKDKDNRGCQVENGQDIV